MSWIKNNEWLRPDTDHSVRWGELKRFGAMYGRFRRPLAGAGVLALLGSATAFAIPAIFFQLQIALFHDDKPRLAVALLAYFAISQLDIATGYFIRVIRTRISTQLNQHLVLRYYEKVLNLAVEDFIAFRQRTNLFQRVVDAMSITPQFTDALVRGGQSVIVILVVGAAIATLSTGVLVVLVVGAALLFAYTLVRARELRELRGRSLGMNYPLVGKMTEIIAGLFTIKALAASPRVTRDVAVLVEGKTSAEFDENRAEAGMQQFSQAIRTATLAFAIAEGVALLVMGQIGFVTLFALYVLTNLFLNPVAELANVYQSLSRLSVNVANFHEVLDLPDEAAEPARALAAVPAEGPAQAVVEAAPTDARRRTRVLAGAAARTASPPGVSGDGGGGRTVRIAPGAAVFGLEDAPPRRGHVVFEGVEFAYRGGPPVLRGVDLEILPGEKVSLIGRSGAGKTTLMRLLLGFVAPQRGRIVVDGEDVARREDRNAYRRQFGVVSQQDVLFGLSVRENLTFGLDEEVPDGRMDEALRLVGLDDAVARAGGLQAPFADDTFSGGQKQRLFIARALLRRPSIVLLDEPTSALDFESEALVIRAIDELVGGRTTITIAHRLSTVRSADRVVVLEGGSVRGVGPHEELYASNDYYRALCDYNSFVV
jgi:ABC-type multidrug transport system fused ATPase/permease subunit